MQVAGHWCDLYRAIDRAGQLLDSMLSEYRDRSAARRFLRRLVEVSGRRPLRVTTDHHGQIFEGPPCFPVAGSSVRFLVNGIPVTSSPPAIWVVGGLPPNAAKGYTLTVASTPTTPAPPLALPPQSSGHGTITAGGRPPAGGGVSIFVFGGGSSSQLLTASGCSASTAVLFASDGNGAFIVYVPGALITVVNAAWNARFAGGIPANTPMIGTCGL